MEWILSLAAWRSDDELTPLAVVHDGHYSTPVAGGRTPERAHRRVNPLWHRFLFHCGRELRFADAYA